MIAPSDTCEVLIVGGGPAGSTCAWRLKQLGVDVRILDRASFPRDKVCAGWITPQVVESLKLDLDEYRSGRVLQPITSFRVGVLDGHAGRDRTVRIDYEQPVSYGIRRCEFDEYLLRRSGVCVQEGVTIRSIQRDGGGWLLNDRYLARILVGAGGHFCPVARFVRADNSREFEPHVVVAQEIEYELPDSAAGCQIDPGIPELYFYPDLKGYAWCFRKGDWLNIGLGRESERNLTSWREEFVQWLITQGRIPESPGRPFKGHAYRLRSALEPASTDEGVVLIGDAAGLADAHSGEGIRPAIESALIAADVIAAANVSWSLEALSGYADRLNERLGVRHEATVSSLLPEGLRSWIAQRLLRSPRFVRRTVIDSWFLNRSTPALRDRQAIS